MDLTNFKRRVTLRTRTIRINWGPTLRKLIVFPPNTYRVRSSIDDATTKKSN